MQAPTGPRMTASCVEEDHRLPNMTAGQPWGRRGRREANLGILAALAATFTAILFAFAIVASFGVAVSLVCFTAVGGVFAGVGARGICGARVLRLVLVGLFLRSRIVRLGRGRATRAAIAR